MVVVFVKQVMPRRGQRNNRPQSLALALNISWVVLATCFIFSDSSLTEIPRVFYAVIWSVHICLALFGTLKPTG